MTTTKKKITADEVRAATGNRYAARVLAFQADDAEIAARARRADAVILDIPQEFRAVFRAAVEAKGIEQDRRVARWQQAVDLDPEFWAQPADPDFYLRPTTTTTTTSPSLRLVRD